MRTRYVLPFTVVVLLLGPTVCFAEVMDKEPSLPAIWTVFVILAVLGYLFGRYRVWGGIAMFMFAALLGSAQIAVMNGSILGPDVARDIGQSYFVETYAALSMALLAPIVGIIQRHFRNPNRIGRG